jgi:hypothetical protein
VPAEASKSGKFLFADRRDGARGLTGGVASIGPEATCSPRTHRGGDLPADGKSQGGTASARTLKSKVPFTTSTSRSTRSRREEDRV